MFTRHASEFTDQAEFGARDTAAAAVARSGEVGAADAVARAAAAAAASLAADEHGPVGAPPPQLRFAVGGGAGRGEDDHGEDGEAQDGDEEDDVAAPDGRGRPGAVVALEHHAAAGHSSCSVPLGETESCLSPRCGTDEARASWWRRLIQAD